MDEDIGRSTPVLRRRRVNPKQRELLNLLRFEPKPEESSKVRRERARISQMADGVRHVNTPTPVTMRFAQGAQAVNRRLAPEAVNTLQGRANSLLQLEKARKSSSVFVTMMTRLREVEALAGSGPVGHFAARDKLLALRQAAQELKDHYADKYAKEVNGKPNSEEAKAHQAAVDILADIDRAANDRQAAIQDFKRLIADLASQVDLREKGGTVPIDAGAIAVLEALNRGPNKPTEIDTVLSNLLKRARQVEGQALLASLGQPGDELRQQVFECKAEICLKFGSAKPPGASETGASDSFFLKGPDGRPAFVFKPMEGEADQSERGWEKGGAAVREVLSSALNDQLSAFGLGCGIPKASVVTLSDDAFKSGNSSQATTRTGTLLEFAPNDSNLTKLLGSPGTTVSEEEMKDYCSDPDELERRKKLINKQDLHNIALFDLITLNLDRSPANLLVRREGSGPNESIRLIPIDGGNMMPPRAALGNNGINGLAPDLKGPKDPLGDSNGLLQLPQSTEPFDDAMAAKIDGLQPDAMVQGLFTAYRKAGNDAPGMKGKVTEPEVFEMMRISMAILKRACGTAANPRLSPADIGEMYHNDLMPLLDRVLGPADGSQPDFVTLSGQALEREIDALIQRQLQRKIEAVRVAKVKAEIVQLGGADRARQLGWAFSQIQTWMTSDPDRVLDILQKNTEEPELLQRFQKMGGDGGMRGKGLDPGAYPTTQKKVEALEPLYIADEYQQRGGDGGVQRCHAAMSGAIASFRSDFEEWNKQRRQIHYAQQGAWMTQNPPLLPMKLMQNSLDEILKLTEFEKLNLLIQMRQHLKEE